MKNLAGLFIVFLLSIILFVQIGCKVDPVESTFPDVTANYDTIIGTIKYKQVDSTGTKLVAWHFGPAMIMATVASSTIASAAVVSDGTFMLILPQTVAGKYFTGMVDFAGTQGGTINVTPQSANFVNSPQFMVDYTDAGHARSLAINLSSFILVDNIPTVDRSYFYNFYGTEGSFTGTSYTGTLFNWAFTKGWGLIDSDFSNNSTHVISSKSVNAAPAGAVWTN
jgi:hypothetical protein